MAADDILILGSILLACGSAGLFVVRLTNARLKGLGWLGAAFGAGGTGAMLMVLSGDLPPWLTSAGADVLILLGFVLLHVAFLDLLEQVSLLPRLGLTLLAIEVGGGAARLAGFGSLRIRLVMIGLVVAAQAGETALLLLRNLRAGIRPPAFFNISLLAGFAILNVARSVGTGLGLIHGPLARWVQTGAFIMFIAVALGMAFGFFWMTTATLTCELDHMASTDPLTRVYNRRAFHQWFAKEVSQSEATGRPLSVLMTDLDHFKGINDRFGHGVGDAVLCSVVEKMQDAVRGIDVVGRWGGEEFVVLLPGASMEAALVVAQRVRRNVEKLNSVGCGEPKINLDDKVRITVSVGVASFHGKGDSMEAMLERADGALYEAKAAGRNCVLSFA